MTSTATQPAHLGNEMDSEDVQASHSPAPPEDHDAIHRPRHDAGAFLQALLELRHLLAAEWSVDILIVLRSGSHRYSELLDQIQLVAGEEHGHTLCSFVAKDLAHVVDSEGVET